MAGVVHCWEHEFAHSFVEERVLGRPSAILWALAHDRPAPDATAHEEALAIEFQGCLNGAWPMAVAAPGVDWPALRAAARAMLGKR